MLKIYKLEANIKHSKKYSNILGFQNTKPLTSATKPCGCRCLVVMSALQEIGAAAHEIRFGGWNNTFNEHSLF